jgi:Spy/CpxP family protein refolding chaperone
MTVAAKKGFDMRTMRRFGVLAASVVLVAAVSAQQPPPSHMPHGQGQAGGGRGMGPGHGPGGPMALFARLNLTDDQKQQVHKLMAGEQQKQQGVMEQMRKLHDQLRDQIFGENGPTGDAKATAQEINRLQGEMMQAHVDMAQQVSAILTAEQRKQIRDMPMGELMGMVPMGMGQRGGPPPQPKK